MKHETNAAEFAKLNPTPPIRGNKRAANGENVLMSYVEDENGVGVDGHKATGMRSLMREIFAHLYSQGVHPRTWAKGDLIVQNFYRETMYRRFPELRLCEGSWKVDKIAIDNYSSWRDVHVKEEEVTVELPGPSVSTPEQPNTKRKQTQTQKVS